MTTSVSTPTFTEMGLAGDEEAGATSANQRASAAFLALGGVPHRRKENGAVGGGAIDYARRGSDDDDDFEEPMTWTQVSPTSTIRPGNNAQSTETGAAGGGGAAGGSNSLEKNKSKLVNSVGKTKTDAKRESSLPDSDSHNNLGAAAGGSYDFGESPCASPGAARRSPPPPPVPPRKPTPSPSPLNSPGGSPPALRRPLPPPPPHSSSSSSSSSTANSHSHHHHNHPSHLSATTADAQQHDVAASVAPPLPRARNARGHCKETQTAKHSGALKIGSSNNGGGGGESTGGNNSRPNSMDISNTPPRHLPPPILAAQSSSSVDSPLQRQRQPSHAHQQQQQPQHESGGPSSLPKNSLTHSRESSSPRPAPPQPSNNVNNNYAKHGNNGTPPHHDTVNNNNVNNNNATPPRPLPPEMSSSSSHHHHPHHPPSEGPRHGRDNITPLDPPASTGLSGSDNNGWADFMQVDFPGNSPSTATGASSSFSIGGNNNAPVERSFASPLSTSSSAHFDDAAFSNGDPPAVPMRKTKPTGQTSRSQVSVVINVHLLS